MKKRWAFLTVLVALALGVAAGQLFGRMAQEAMHVALSCVLLSQAEKAGYVDKQKRSALIAKLATSASLSSSEQRSVSRLLPECLET